jgi:hypothetical protein
VQKTKNRKKKRSKAGNFTKETKNKPCSPCSVGKEKLAKKKEKMYKPLKKRVEDTVRE